MGTPVRLKPNLRFGAFELDAHTRELHTNGRTLKLQEQSFQLLIALLERPGQLITRDELKSRLWPADTFVDFEHSINKAMNRLREILGDSAGQPQYIETFPRLGYRLIVPVETSDRPAVFHDATTPALLTLLKARRLWTAIILSIGLLLVGTWVWRSRRHPLPKLLNVVQLTHDRVPKYGAVTDGYRLYITEWLGSKLILVQGAVIGGETSVIPTPFASSVVTDVSIDHSRLLVTDDFQSGQDTGFWLLPLVGGAPWRLGNISGHEAVWSSDGRQLAFSKGSEIYIASADGNNAHKLATFPGFALSIRFSPDGSHLRFTVEDTRSNTESIWEIRADGTDLHLLFPGWHKPAWECCGTWTPDGRYYLFSVGNESHNYNVWARREPATIFEKATPPIRLTNGPMSFAPMAPSPDGRRFFAHGWLARGELVRYDRKSRSLVPYLSDISPAGGLDFSQDGQWIAYVSYPERILWRSRVDGSERLQLTTPPVTPFFPHWSPDGKQIAYVDSLNFKIFLVSAGGGIAQEMYPEEHQQLDASWSPSGRQIAFGGTPRFIQGSEKVSIHVFDTKSKKVETIPGSDNLYAPRWSPDGRHLAALSADDTKLLRFDFASQKWTEWVKGTQISGPSWSRDGKYIYYGYTTKGTDEYRRSQIGQTGSELVVDLSNLLRLGPWSGLAPDDSPLFIHDVSNDEIYSLELDLP